MIFERLETESPEAGEIAENVETLLDQLETALMKRGTLSAQTINWQQVANDAKAVLKDCLHLQALRALVFSLCHSQSESDLADAMHLVEAGLAPRAWALFHPQGPKGDRRRRQWGVDMLLALQQALKQVDLATRGLPEEMLAKADALAKSAAAIGLDSAAYQTSLRDLRQRGQAVVNNHPALQDRAGDAPGELDAKGRAELRRDLRSAAERINAHEPAAEIGFLIRRYAAWLEFRSLPAVDGEGRIPQQPMPASIVDEFRSHAERPTNNALLRLEDRLFNNPDWFEGQQLAARMAHGLGYAAAAEAIRDSVARRLSDLPGLARLRYANDVPYLDPSVADWAKCAVRLSSSGVDEEKVETEIAEPSLKDRIAALEVEVTSRRSRRARAVAKFTLARELSGAGLSGHARILLQELSETLSEPVLAGWDSELADEIRNALGRVN